MPLATAGGGVAAGDDDVHRAVAVVAAVLGMDPDAPPMRPYFHFATDDYVLFAAWLPRAPLEYAATLAAVCVLGVLTVALRALAAHFLHDAHAAGAAMHARAVDDVADVSGGRDNDSDGADGSDGVAVHDADDDAGDGGGAPAAFATASTPLVDASWVGAGGVRRRRRRFSCARNSTAAALSFASAALGYALMLVVMTFNAGLVLAAVVGVAVGHFAFAHHLHGVHTH